MNNDMLNFLVLLIIMFVITLGIGYCINNAKCSAKAEALGYQCDYKLMQGCVLIKPNGKKILLEQLREYAE